MTHQRHSGMMILWIAAGLALGLVGCSMHPLPENVSPASTFDIVERVRCEVLEGLSHFEPEEQARANKIIASTKIGYDFDFLITELNRSTSGRLEYKRAAFKGTNKGFFLDLSASSQRIRSNTRAFRIIDNLADLKAEKAERCARTTTTANGLYPITGATGMAEIVRTYVKLEILTDLARGDDQGTVFSDELHFRTILSAGVSPKLELRTIAGDFRLSHTSFMGTVKRDDAHSVTVAMTRGPGDPDLVATVVSLGDPARAAIPPLQGEPLIRPYRTLRRLAASQTAPETRILYELQRRRNAREDARVVNRILTGAE